MGTLLNLSGVHVLYILLENHSSNSIKTSENWPVRLAFHWKRNKRKLSYGVFHDYPWWPIDLGVEWKYNAQEAPILQIIVIVVDVLLPLWAKSSYFQNISTIAIIKKEFHRGTAILICMIWSIDISSYLMFICVTYVHINLRA